MPTKNPFTGTGTALITPLKACGGPVDRPALEFLVNQQIKAGVDFLVPTGTTGGSPTLGWEEHIAVIKLVLEITAGRVPVLAGTGGNSTAEAIALTLAAENAGARASLQVAPYYNRPMSEGLFQHFRAVAKAAPGMQFVLYNIPARCGVDVVPDIVARIREHCSNVVGIKEASGNADRVSQLRATLGDDFTILSGDDSLTLPFMAVGAKGVISVASNIIPREVACMVRAFRDSRLAEALESHLRLFRLFRALFMETNPIPVMTALAMMFPEQIQESFRSPLWPMAPENRAKLRAVLEDYGLVNKEGE